MFSYKDHLEIKNKRYWAVCVVVVVAAGVVWVDIHDVDVFDIDLSVEGVVVVLLFLLLHPQLDVVNSFEADLLVRLVEQRQVAINGNLIELEVTSCCSLLRCQLSGTSRLMFPVTLIQIGNHSF